MVLRSQNNFRIEIFENSNFSFEITEFIFHRLESFLDLRSCAMNHVNHGLYDNLCTPFKHDIRCASLCGVEFVVTKKRREKRAQRESCLKGVQRL